MRKLLELTNIEIQKANSKKSGEMPILEKQLNNKQSKLDRFYDALESGEFSYEDLSARIRKLKSETDKIGRLINQLQMEIKIRKPVKRLSKSELDKYVQI
jgi:predicted  nucleic acid-binding Zn-ribbon protein